MVKYSKRGNYALRTPFTSQEPAVRGRRRYGPAFPLKENAIRIPRWILMNNEESDSTKQGTILCTNYGPIKIINLARTTSMPIHAIGVGFWGRLWGLGWQWGQWWRRDWSCWPTTSASSVRRRVHQLG